MKHTKLSCILPCTHLTANTRPHRMSDFTDDELVFPSLSITCHRTSKQKTETFSSRGHRAVPRQTEAAGPPLVSFRILKRENEYVEKEEEERET